MSKIDLHIHTNFSDGLLSPKEIIDEAIKNNVQIISITDHDTIDAYTDELYNYAESKNIKIINGVEISVKTDKVGIHVLGYNFDINNKVLREKLFTLRNARHTYLHNVSLKLRELGYITNEQELDKLEVVTKAHISLDIINNKENEKLLLKTFGAIPSKGEFIETIMNEGCPAFVEKEAINPKEAANLIRSAGGKVILAHPIAYKHEDGLTEADILNLVNDMDADGIESNYIYTKQDGQRVNEINIWNKFAKENNLITTIGSDFHKKSGRHPEIGLIDEDLNLSDKMIDETINFLIK